MGVDRLETLLCIFRLLVCGRLSLRGVALVLVYWAVFVL